MNICGLCQQICNNLTKIYSNRFKTLAQIILRLKGFKESQEISSVLIICDNCKQGIESVAKFWEHIPEAKQENLSNNASNLQEIYETSPNSNYQDEMVTYAAQNLPAIKLDEKNNDEKDVIKKPIKLKIRKKRKESNSYAVVSSTTTEECSEKRHRQPPKRYSDYDIELTSYPERVSRNHIKIMENRLSPRKSSFNKLPVALILSKSGVTLGHLIEIENKTQTSRMRMICVICLNVFSYEKEFHKHLEIHKTKGLVGAETIDCNDFLYSCKLCEKSFKEHYAVRRHYKFVHSEERPLKCKHCSANFKYKFNLDYHMAKHIPKRRFECSHCKKAFVMRYELQIHLRTHTKEKPYKCEFCTYAFAHRSNLKAHQKLKHLQNSSGLDAPINEVNYYTENNLGSIKNTKQLGKADHIPANVEKNNNDNSLSSLMIKSKSEEISLTDINCNDDSINFSVENSMRKESVLSESLNNEKRTSFLQIEYKPNETNNTSNQIPLKEENKMLIRSNSNSAGNFLYDYRKQFSSAASMYSFKIPNTTLRIISQSPLLTMKKWPKSYQRAITETPHITTFESISTITEQKSSNVKKENSENNIELCSKDTEFKSIRPAISECQKSNAVETKTIATNEFNLEPETCNNFQTVLIYEKSRNIFSEISNDLVQNTDNGSTGTKKSSAIDDIQSDKEFVSSNTSCNKNVSENIDIKCGFVPTDTSTPSKTKEFVTLTTLTKPNSLAKVCRNATKAEEIIDVGKFSKFSPIILDPKNLENIQIIKVTSRNDSSNNINAKVKCNNPVKVSNASSIKTRVKSPTNDVFKVSSKPVKIIKLTKLKNSSSILGSSQEFNLLKSKSLTSSSIRKSPIKDIHNLSDRITRIIKNNSTQSIQAQQINNFDLNMSTKIENIANNFPDKCSKSNGLTKGNSTQSLLKPNIKAQQTYTFDLNATTKTNGLTLQFCDKPLITKVEILPPLTAVPALDKSLASSSTPQINVQPLKEYKFQCPYCWKYFKQKSPLTKHIRTHTGEKPYKCNLCLKSYADASNFKKHKILHKNAAEALNISNTSTNYPVQSSPAQSTVSDPDPDGIEVMQTIKKYNCSPLDKNNDIYDDDTASLTSSTMESYMWEDALDHALSNDEIQESIKRNLASFNNAIMLNNVENKSKKNKISMNRQISCEDPD